ncbi:MAG: hypothetical protein NDI94_04515 [Candidatus Woesearchaeota archaeon]|nr:hypothetical protein [Candidatus Woesearchaeota archaeon]
MRIDQLLASLAVFSAIAVPFLGLKGVLLAMIYTLFIFMPCHFFISKIDIGFLERFILTNIAGLSYSMILAILDVTLKIKLSKVMFIAVPLIIMVSSRLRK